MAGIAYVETKAAARTFFALVGLAEFESQYPSQIAGDMQQRVGVARASADYTARR